MNNELKIWFDNVVNYKQNNKILFIDNIDENIIIRIKDYYLKKSNIKTFIKINFLYSKNISETSPINSNSLVYLKSANAFATFDILDKEIIYVSDFSFIKEFEIFINSFDLNNQSKKIDRINYSNYLLVKKEEFKNVIKNKENLFEMIRIRKNVLEKILGKGFIFQEEHLNILKNKNILTASLGQYLYRIFTLDFSSSVTKIGTTIRKDLKLKSKTFSHKFLTDRKTNNHNLKAYDLNINNTIETDIKIKIAKNLLDLQYEKLDLKTIAKITELTEEFINEKIIVVKKSKAEETKEPNNKPVINKDAIYANFNDS